MGISRGHVKALCARGLTNDVFNQRSGALRGLSGVSAEDHDASALAHQSSLRLKMKKIEKAMLEGEDEVEEEL